MADSFEEKIGSIRTELLVAYIFAILVFVGWIIGLLYGLFVLIALGILGGPYLAPIFVPLGITYLIVFLIFMIPSILVMRRTGRMYKAAKSKDVKTLKELNSIGWAIVALIFTGIISGVMLLIAHGPITTLLEGGISSSSEDLDRIIKLKSLLDSGVITKEEFERQKNAVLHPESSGYPQGGEEEELKKLKSLLDSGAISQSEYEEQRRAILNKMMSK